MARAGREITEDTTLDHDLTATSRPALVVTADNVVLDLGGHTVSGDRAGFGTGPGVLLENVRGVTVRNGTIRRFDAGVAIEGGEGNVVEGLTVEDNQGDPDGDFGDGIVVNRSHHNRILDNTVVRNGPFSGIALGPLAQHNEIRGNRVADNNMLQLGAGAGGQTMGIRVEGPEANDNRIVDNVVTASGADGIVILSTCHDMAAEPPCVGTPPNERNDVVGNTANGNGTSGRGSGIRVFAMPLPIPPVGTSIRDNVADGNAWYGIAIDSLPLRYPGSEVVGNRAHGNGEFDGSDGTLMPPCGKNVWRDNDFGTVNQPGVAKTGERS